MKTQNVVLLSLAIIIAAAIVSLGLTHITEKKGVVSVRGLAEREVDADLAVWPLTYSVGGNDLQTIRKSVIEKNKIVEAYLKRKGLTKDDYTIQAPDLTDNTVNSYARDARYDYVARQVVLVRSTNVAAVKDAHANSLDLLAEGIAITIDYSSKVEYDFTKLNDVKPEMVDEAQKNALKAAEQIVGNGVAKLKIKSASQGYFSVEDAAQGLEDRKKVRVVTTIQYTIE